MGKTFEKQIKTIEDQGERQVEVLKGLKYHSKQLTNDCEDKLLISKEWEIFKNIYNKNPDKIKDNDNNLDLLS